MCPVKKHDGQKQSAKKKKKKKKKKHAPWKRSLTLLDENGINVRATTCTQYVHISM